MKKWMQKLVEQLTWTSHAEQGHHHPTDFHNLSEELATLLFVIDTYGKHLLDVEHHPIRRIREELDQYARGLLSQDKEMQEKTLFRFRQFFERYRLDETAHVQKTFDDFRNIIWDFVDQLSEEIHDEENSNNSLQQKLSQLKEAVEANSVHELKSQARGFIDSYIEYQTRRDDRKYRRLESVKEHLDKMKKQLNDANNSMKLDHLTKAFNRKSFDENIKQVWNMNRLYNKNVTLLALDIDHFKKINDTYGHAMGDFILIEFVKIMKSFFPRDVDFVARVGGEEFAILLPDYAIVHALKKSEDLLKKVRSERFVQDGHTLQFTCSIGIAQLEPQETIEQWMKRADEALYEAKRSGRDKFVVAQAQTKAA